MQLMHPNPPLSNLQLELLKVFSRPVPDEDLLAIKQLLSDFFAQKAANLANEVWEREGLIQWQQDHLRTDYKAPQRDSAQS